MILPFLLVSQLSTALTWAGGNICGPDQVYPPANQATGSNSYQNPACLPGGALAYTVWIYGYNGTENEEAERADMYFLDPRQPGSPPTFIGSRDPLVNKVNNIGHIAQGGLITYACHGNRICVSDLHGGNAVVSESPGGGGGFQEPSFDPTGEFVAFEFTKSESKKGESGRADLCVVSARTLKGSRCASMDGFNKQPDWGPKGIVFQRQHKGRWDLFLISARNGAFDKSSLKQLTHSGNATDASWAPDGQRIVYSCGGKICSLDSSTGQSTKIPTRGGSYMGAVSACADGFVYYETGNGDEKPTAICRARFP